MIYKEIYFEISGLCQAKCPYCAKNYLSSNRFNGRFIQLKEFSEVIETLFKKKLVNVGALFNLYNWGEPFLHPNLINILEIAKSFPIKYRLSTNGGIYKKIPFEITESLARLTITIPGFSQKSYKRVHGLNYYNVIENIKKFSNDINPSKIKIVFLVHQFNLNEIYDSFHYFNKLGISTIYTVAYLNGYSLARDFLLNKLDGEILGRIGRDLFLSYIDELIESRPKNYICPQYSILAIDENCNVLTCCVIDKGHKEYSLGSLFKLSAEEIVSGKQNREICKECSELGIDYWAQTPPNFSFIQKITCEELSILQLMTTLKRKVVQKIKKFFRF